jgi:hypothetical protein
MFNTNSQRRSRHGQFAPTDREHPTTEQRKAYRTAEAELMNRNRVASFDVHCQPPSFAARAAHEGMKAIAAIHRGNAMMARDYAREAAHLAMMEVGR